MRDPEEIRSAPGRPIKMGAGAALLVALVAGCAGENLFPSFLVTAPVSLLGPEVDITAPVPPVSIPPGDSVNVSASISSGEGVSQVSFTGVLEAGGATAFTPVAVTLTSAPRDTTISRFLRRSGATSGTAKIIVTATDLTGDTGADTISVNLTP